MKTITIAVVALAGCQSSQPVEHYGFIARLGNDTISVESVTRRGDEIVSADSVHITKRDSTGTQKIAFATGSALAMPHLPQMYSLAGGLR